MKPQDQIKALAELDGCKICTHVPDYWDRVGTEQDSELYCRECREFLHHMREKPYRTSYDAIIPLIQKALSTMLRPCFFDNLGMLVAKDTADCDGQYNWQGDGSYYEQWLLFKATPAQLCEALLRATGKWKDNE